MKFGLGPCAVGIAIVAVCLTEGCSEQAHLQDLKDRVRASYSTSAPDHLYYIGSENGFDDYYLEREDKRYRVPTAESMRDDRIPLTNDRSKWQIVNTLSPLESIHSEKD